MNIISPHLFLQIYKSTKCNDMKQTGYCPRGPFCAFAHVESKFKKKNLCLVVNSLGWKSSIEFCLFLRNSFFWGDHEHSAHSNAVRLSGKTELPTLFRVFQQWLEQPHQFHHQQHNQQRADSKRMCLPVCTHLPHRFWRAEGKRPFWISQQSICSI